MHLRDRQECWKWEMKAAGLEQSRSKAEGQRSIKEPLLSCCFLFADLLLKRLESSLCSLKLRV